MSATAFVGAGGGGDTVCAALRALAQPTDVAGACYVLGAGYDLGEYVTALQSGAPGDRLPCLPDDAAAYLASATEPLPGAAGAWRVCALTPAECAAFAAPLLPPGKPPTWTSNARFVYKTLLEERSFAARLVQHCASPPEMHMFASTTQPPGTAAYDSMLATLRAYVAACGVTHLVVYDAGGDIFDCGRLGRDVSVLHACRALAAETGLRLTVEVYGIGSDGHADAAAALGRLDAVKATAEHSGPGCAAFIDLLDTEAASLAAEVLGAGRATGNFVLACRLLAQVAASELSIEEAYTQYTAGLHARTEYARAKPEWQAAFDAANHALGPEAVLRAGAASFALDLRGEASS